MSTSTPQGIPAVPTPAQAAPASFTPSVTVTVPSADASSKRDMAKSFVSENTGLVAIIAGLFVAAGAAAAYHGYKRNGGSKSSAAAWGLGGLVFPPVLLTALQQGYAEPSEKVYLQRIIRDIDKRPDLLAAVHGVSY